MSATAPTGGDLLVRREALGLDRAWFADMLGVDPQSIRRMELGKWWDEAFVARAWALILEGERRRDAMLDNAAILLGLDGDDADDALTAAGIEQLDVTVYRNDRSFWTAHPESEPWPASWHRATVRLIVDMTDLPVRFHIAPTENSADERADA